MKPSAVLSSLESKRRHQAANCWVALGKRKSLHRADPGHVKVRNVPGEMGGQIRSGLECSVGLRATKERCHILPDSQTEGLLRPAGPPIHLSYCSHVCTGDLGPLDRSPSR